MKKVQYDDLVGVPYAKWTSGPDTYDCIGVTREVYHRAGLDGSGLPTADNEEALLAALDCEGATPWVAVDAVVDGMVVEQLQFGDVVMMDTGDGMHVSVIVDESKQVALSAGDGYGVYSCAASWLTKVTAVYRLREMAV